MMRQMRENTKWIMLVTAIAFVALMIFQWGMDISGRSGGSLGEIGRVNGEAVLYDDYLAVYRGLYDEVQAGQQQPISSQQNRDLEQAAWDQIVTRILIQQELDRRGIQVTDEEIKEAAIYSPPPVIQNDPAFRTNGQFDLAKYQAFIQSPTVDEQTLLYLESYYRDVIPRGKLLRQLTAGVFASDAELWQDWLEQNERVTVNVVALNPGSRIADADAPVSEAEVRDYYNAHEDDFKKPAQATVRYVAMSKAATAADTAASLEKARAVRAELLAGADFAEVAKRESIDSVSAANGGSLGTLGKGALIKEFEDAAFAAPVGQVTEPLKTSYGYHLIKVEKKTADSITARHILIPIKRDEPSETALLMAADSLERESENKTLTAAAQGFGLKVETGSLNSEFPFLPGVGQAGEGSDWALEEAAPGDVSPLFESTDAFYLLELVEASPEGMISPEDAKPTIETILRIRKKVEKGMEEGRALVAAVRGGKTLAAAAAEKGLTVAPAGPFTRRDYVPVLGRENAAIGAAFGLKSGQVSEPVTATSNVYVLEFVSRQPADSAAWVAQKDTQRQTLTQLMQQRRMDQWLEGIRAQAKIVDRRKEVLKPDTTQTALPPLGG
jgi:peptidyl-prolyl cis-trans isomerase D